MLDLRAHHGDDAVGPFVEGMQRATLRGLANDTPDLARSPERFLALSTDIALVGPDRRLLTVQQFVPNLTVVKFGGRGIEAVHHAAVGIDADVGFHSEIPVVALLGGRHLGVARARLVLRRGRRINDRRVDQRAGAQGDALVRQIRVDLGEDRLAQPVLLQKVAEVEGPISALTVETFAPPIAQFKRGRDFPAWLGLVPLQASTGGKQRLGTLGAAPWRPAESIAGAPFGPQASAGRRLGAGQQDGVRHLGHANAR